MGAKPMVPKGLQGYRSSVDKRSYRDGMSVLFWVKERRFITESWHKASLNQCALGKRIVKRGMNNKKGLPRD